MTLSLEHYEKSHHVDDTSLLPYAFMHKSRLTNTTNLSIWQCEYALVAVFAFAMMMSMYKRQSNDVSTAEEREDEEILPGHNFNIRNSKKQIKLLDG